jgi:tetratricopeptide (TPR) repeat protein
MLKAKRKYTKQELKQDKFILATVQAKTFVEEHSTKILYAVLAVIAVALLIWFYIDSKKSASQEAEAMLSKAQNEFHLGQKEAAITSFSELADRYPGTPAAGKAVFFLARIYLDDDNIEQAKKYYKLYIDDYADKNVMAQGACAGYADCLAYEKNYREAAEYYEKAAQIYPDFPQADTYLYSAASAYKEAGEVDKAKKLSQELIDESENQNIKNRAEVLLESLSM